jgi:predicted 2-oxoglutarate/Fe(II)-dependent dioxygenase YbiX
MPKLWPELRSLGVVAGRWVALCFLGALNQSETLLALTEMLGEAALFNDDHMVFYGVLTGEPKEARQLAEASHRALGFITDYNGEITRMYGAVNSPRLIVLDPLLRPVCNLPIGAGGTPNEILRKTLRNLPKVDDYAGVPLCAPALTVPRVFEPDFCKTLIAMYENGNNVDSGFMLDKNGKTETVINHNLKSRRDWTVTAPDVRAMMRDRVARRLVPMIERFFQYRPTRMDRCLVSCYDAETGGHFSRHRDNVNAGARHRRFAVSINLNDDFEGCELVFPEFGRHKYRAPHCGAVVFSTGALHEVLPMRRGKRYAFIPFLYGEEEARLRAANNALLKEGELMYVEGSDKLFP